MDSFVLAKLVDIDMGSIPTNEDGNDPGTGGSYCVIA
jgi:hypothetical protein